MRTTLDSLQVDVLRMNLGATDTLVVKIPGAVSKETQEVLCQHFQNLLGSEQKILVLEAGVDLGVIRQKT